MFQPQVLTEEEIRSLLTDLSGEEIEQARALSLTPLKREILYEGVPGGAIVRDITGKEYIDCTAQAKAPATERAAALVELAMERGVIFDLDMPDIVHGLPTRRNVVKIKPPLTITQEQLDRALDLFEDVLEKVSQLPPAALEKIRHQMIEAARAR